jgi:hypothetical protein
MTGEDAKVLHCVSLTLKAWVEITVRRNARQANESTFRGFWEPFYDLVQHVG